MAAGVPARQLLRAGGGVRPQPRRALGGWPHARPQPLLPQLSTAQNALRDPRHPAFVPLAGQGRPPRFRHFATFVDLRGDFSFDAISPDGSTVYLIHRYLPPSSGPNYITNYEVRALDVERGRLLPEPIVDPEEPDERMQGLPITRETSPDGRWAYTLYDGNGHEPFIHALDTVGRRAVCIDPPQLASLVLLSPLG